MALLASPAWLLALPPLLLTLWWLGRSTSISVHDRRRRWRFAWRALCLTSLLLVLAGLRFPSNQAQIELIAAVDVSDSVWNRNAQQAALRNLATQLEETDARLGVVAFAATATAERAPAPVSVSKKAPAQLPDLMRTVVPGSETDVGAALDRARGLLGSGASGRAIVLISDGHDTTGRADDRAAALRGSGIDLLAWPAALSAGGDVVLASFNVPERAQLGRSVPLLVSVSAQREARVRVRVGLRVSKGIEPIGAEEVTLVPVGDEFRATLRFAHRPSQLGKAVYLASVEGPAGEPLAGDYRQNNTLAAAVHVDGPSRWLTVSRPGSTLYQWAENESEALGVKLVGVRPRQLPKSPDAYAEYSGILVGDVSASEWPDDDPGLKALASAVRDRGRSLVAVGGEKAFGAGRHREKGTWEDLLPVTFLPEDDRTRSILFVLDTSATMKQMMATRQEQKLAFACACLSEVTQPGSSSKLRPTDRIGLIAFNHAAELKTPLTREPKREAFRRALDSLRPEGQTNFPAALELAHKTLAKDDAEEQVVIFVSDGEPTPMISDQILGDAVKKLCPGTGAKRRTRLHTFGIATGEADRNVEGERRLKLMASIGGGRCFPEFPKLSEELSRLLKEPRPDLYLRREPFAIRLPLPQHPLLVPIGSWPQLRFRNRVRARPESVTLAQSAPIEETGGKRQSDPLLILGHHGIGKTAVLALTLDGPDGRRLLAEGDTWKGGGALLAALLSWIERGDDVARAEWQIETEEKEERLVIRVKAHEPNTRKPRNSLQLAAALSPVFTEGSPGDTIDLLPVAPGVYKGAFELPRREVTQAGELASVYRLSIQRDGGRVAERFVSIPYPPEYGRFGTDRTKLGQLVRLAGGRSRMLDLPGSLKAWMKEVETQRAYVSMRPALLILAALCLLAEVAARGLRKRTV